MKSDQRVPVDIYMSNPFFDGAKFIGAWRGGEPLDLGYARYIHASLGAVCKHEPLYRADATVPPPVPYKLLTQTPSREERERARQEALRRYEERRRTRVWRWRSSLLRAAGTAFERVLGERRARRARLLHMEHVLPGDMSSGRYEWRGNIRFKRTAHPLNYEFKCEGVKGVVEKTSSVWSATAGEHEGLGDTREDAVTAVVWCAS